MVCGGRRGAGAVRGRVPGGPVLCCGAVEKVDGVGVLDAGRLAGRVLGMGDVIGLVEKAQAAVTEQEAARLGERMKKGDFTLEDFLEQMLAIKKMGPISGILGMLPGMGQFKEAISQVDDGDIDRIAAIIRSMTPGERKDPKLINGSRRARIAAGAGRTVTSGKDRESTRPKPTH